MSGINISIYFLVPFVWGMGSVFAYIVSFQISTVLGSSPYIGQIHSLAGCLIFSGSFATGYAVLRFVLKPTEELLDRLNKTISPVENTEADTGRENRLNKHRHRNWFFLDELDEYRKVFGKIAVGSDIKKLQDQFPHILFKSREMAYVLEQVLKVAPSPAGVLILGQSGTGKELIADAVHEKSPRKDGPLIKVNCGAISPGLLESELFGHEKGAFTGAVALHKGCFERSDKGSIFLDEVGEMPQEVQVKLLRVLQNGEFFRVGGQKPFKVDVRVIAATNKNLEALVAQGRFREDLFYRLNVFNIILPPLARRENDIELLAGHFAQKKGKKISDETMGFLKSHDWKGNIRELENKIEQAVICCDTEVLQTEHFDFQQAAGLTPSSPAQEDSVLLPDKEDFSLNDELGRIEVEFIVQALRKNNGVQARAADMLGIKPRSLWNRIKKYGINAGEFK